MKTLIITVLLVAFMAGCSSLPDVPDAVLKHGDTRRWARDQVEGLCIRRENETTFDTMSFNRGGIFTGSGGPKDGMICMGGVTGWRLKRGRLFHTDVEGHHLGSEFHLVSLTDTELKYRDGSGELYVYQVVPERSPIPE